MFWPALTETEVQRRVHEALDINRSYRAHDVLGLPGTVLDRRVFPPIPPVMDRAFLRTCVENPNHIGCHTTGTSEPAFSGTHQLEQEVVALCAEQILHARPDSIDGYIASGGTESNIQALWAFRNSWRQEGVDSRRIGILCSEDTHYSIHKGADLLGLAIETVPVDEWTRQMSAAAVCEARSRLEQRGITHVVVVLNMGTTMFGSVDEPDTVLDELTDLPTRVHVDAAFGGFIYPFTVPDQPLHFADPRIDTITLDAHKMLQAPYGTGIHLARKGLLEATTNRQASYVPGHDCTLVGSRSGANAVAVWMILNTYGSDGGAAFCQRLVSRAERLVAGLEDRGVRAVHTPGMNVVTMRDEDVPADAVERFLLVADDHDAPRWRKVVVMDHVTDEAIDELLGFFGRVYGV